jgi:hypothetical protein
VTPGREDEVFLVPLFATGDLWMIDYLDVSSIDLQCCVCCFFIFICKTLRCLSLVILNVIKDCLRCCKGRYAMLDG